MMLSLRLLWSNPYKKVQIKIFQGRPPDPLNNQTLRTISHQIKNNQTEGTALVQMLNNQTILTTSLKILNNQT